MSPQPATEAQLTARDTAELLHAELGYLLDRVGIPVLHVKGPTVATWLYEPGERPWGDVDVWVPPDLLDDALAVLRMHGIAERHAELNHRTSRTHAVVVSRAPDSPGGGEIDLHHRFPGVTADPAGAFDVLWRRRVDAELAHTAVWFPDVSTRALLVALNTARSPWSTQAREDLDRAAAAAVDWGDVGSLAERLGAGPALHAGLELSGAGRAVLAAHPALAVPITPEWRLRVTDAPLTALRLTELRSTRWVDRPALVGRWLVPHPAVVRMRDPRASKGRSALARAYVRRLLEGLRGAGTAVNQAREAHRG